MKLLSNLSKILLLSSFAYSGYANATIGDTSQGALLIKNMSSIPVYVDEQELPPNSTTYAEEDYSGGGSTLETEMKNIYSTYSQTPDQVICGVKEYIDQNDMPGGTASSIPGSQLGWFLDTENNTWDTSFTIYRDPENAQPTDLVMLGGNGWFGGDYDHLFPKCSVDKIDFGVTYTPVMNYQNIRVDTYITITDQ